MLKKLFTVALALLPLTATAKENVVLNERNSTALVDVVDEESVGKVIAFINLTTEQDVYLYIDSPGGSVFAGLKLVEVLNNTTKNVTCVVSQAASMAFVITQACHKRLITETGMLMQHVSSYGMRGQEPNNFSFAGFIRTVSEKMDQAQAKRIGLSYDEFRKKVRDDWWLYGSEAVSAHAADGLASVSCDHKLVEKIITKTFQVFIFTVKVDFSACPLITSPVETNTKKIALGGDKNYDVELSQFFNNLNNRRVIDKNKGFIWEN